MSLQAKGSRPVIPAYLPLPPRDNTRAAFHVRLRGIQLAGVEGREDHITLLVGQRASAINVFLIIRFHVKGCAPRAILSSIGSPLRFCVVPTASSRRAVPTPGIPRLCKGRKMK
jgi:hypothetical protein